MTSPSGKTTLLVDELSAIDGYKLTTGLIVPRPIGWIGSRSAEGAHNLAPYSFFNAVSGNPPTIVFSPAAGPNARRDTATNVLATGEFSVNIVTAEVAEAMNATSASLAPDEDEFVHAGLTATAGSVIDAPLVRECRAQLECVLVDHLHIGATDAGNTLIVGQVVAFHIDDELLDGTRIDQEGLQAIGRHAGNTYSNATDLFELKRPD